MSRKIPFDVKFKPQIESGEYKVETRDGRVVHNIWWVKKPSYTNNRKMEVCALIDGEEDVLVFFEGGRYLPTTKDTDSPFDLFIITPESELTDWEKFVSGCLQKYGLLDCGASDKIAKECSAELLALAREQFIKDGYVIEKKAFHDAVENISDKHRAEMSVEYSIHCKVKDGTRHAIMNWEAFQKVAQKFIDIGKAEALKEIEQDPESSYAFKRGVEYGKEEALKDLPRWKPAARAYEGDRLPRIDWLLKRLVAKFEEGIFYLDMNDLYKLPGFKED